MSKATALPRCDTGGEVGGFWLGTSGVAAVSLGASHGSTACSDLCGTLISSLCPRQPLAASVHSSAACRALGAVTRQH